MPAMTRLDLDPRYLAALQSLLKAQVPAAEVWVYGSRVTGTAHETSDVDIVLRNPGDLSRPQSAMSGLIEALQESTIPLMVDVHDWARLPETFYPQIEAAYVVIQPAR